MDVCAADEAEPEPEVVDEAPDGAEPEAEPVELAPLVAEPELLGSAPAGGRGQVAGGLGWRGTGHSAWTECHARAWCELERGTSPSQPARPQRPLADSNRAGVSRFGLLYEAGAHTPTLKVAQSRSGGYS